MRVRPKGGSVAGIKIISDSACDVPKDLVETLAITVIPLSIRFGTEEYVDQVDLTPAQFWAKCSSSSTLPETAAPSPGAFQEAFQEAKDAGYDGVVCLTLSSDLSATYQAALAAGESMAPYPVAVIDSRAVTLAQGLLVIDAAERALAGDDFDAIVAAMMSNIERTHVTGALDTLEHLKKGGRVGGAQALLGSVLNIKPLLELRDGKVAEAGRQRTRAKALRHVAEVARQNAPFARFGLVHGSAEDFQVLLDQVSDIECDTPIVVSEMGSVVGTHGGPGIVGLCWIQRG